MDRESLKTMLIELVEQETWEKLDSLDEQAKLKEGLKLDSVDMISLVLEVERKFNVQITSSDLEQLERVGQLLDLLERKIAARSSSKAA